MRLLPFALSKRLIKGFSGTGAALLSSGADGLILGAQFLTSVMTARALLPEGRGELTTILLWPTFFFSIIGSGFKFSMLYHIARFQDRRSEIIYFGFWLLLLVSPVVALCNFAFAEFALNKISTQAVGLTQLLGCFVPILLLCSFAQIILQGDRSFKSWNLLRISDAYLFLLIVIVLFAINRANLVEVTLSFLVGKFVMLALASRFIIFKRPESLDRQLCRSQLGYIGKCLPTGWMGQANTQMDQMLLSVFFRPELLGLYRVAVSAANFVRFVPVGFQRTILSQTASIETSRSQIAHIFRSAKQGGALTLIAVIPFLALIGFFINIAYGAAFDEAVPVARVLVVAAGVVGMSGIIGNGIKGMGRPLVLMYAELGALVVTAMGLPFLLPRIGILGAGVTSLLAYLVTCTCLVLYLLKIMKGSK